jgi:CDP-glucose 4,6-dehydratase
VRGNLSSVDDCARAVNANDVTTVFHLGAQTIVGTALRDPFETFESNIRGTYNLLEAVRRLTPLVSEVVIASSDKAYGESAILPYTEDMPLNGKHPYDVSKSCADLLGASYAFAYGMPVSIARCGNIYGGGDLNWSRIVPGTIRSLLLNEVPVVRSSGGFIRDYIYVRDAVGAYIALAEATAAGGIAGEAFNFSTGSHCTVLEIVDAIMKAMGVNVQPRILDSAKLELVNQTLDSSKAHARLGWQATWSLDEGLVETVAWYRDHFTNVKPKIIR